MVMLIRNIYWGGLYQNGIDVPKDNIQAANWYTKAAKQDYFLAQNNLGFMYLQGNGVQKDDDMALYWFRKSAEQGYADAKINLGYMYFYGKGVPKSNVAAYGFYNWVDRFNINAKKNLDEIVKTMTDNEIEAGKEITKELLKDKMYIYIIDNSLKKQ